MRTQIISLSAIFSAIALMTVSCAQEQEVQQKNVGTVEHEVHIVAQNSNDTKALLESGENAYISKWEGNEQIGVFQSYTLNSETAYGDMKSSSQVTLSEESTKADFTVTLDEVPGATNYKYVAVYPANAATRDGSDIKIVIPSTQTFAVTNPETNKTVLDPTADAMYSQMVTRAEFSDEALSMGFARAGTIVRMTLKGLIAGETVNDVVLSTTEANKYLVGTVAYDLTTGDLKDGVSSGSQSLTLNAPEGTVVPSNGNLTIWFRTAAVSLSDNLTVTVRTQIHKYSKTFTPNSNFSFQNGHLASFGVTVIPVLEAGYYVIHYTDGSTDKAMSNASTGSGSGYFDAVVNPFEADANGKYGVTSDKLNFMWEVSINNDGKYAFRSVETSKYMTGTGDVYNTNTTAEYYFVGANTGNYLGTFSVYNGANFESAHHLGYNENNGNSRFKFYTSPLTHLPGHLTFTPAYSAPTVIYNNINLANADAISSKVTITPTTFAFTNSIALVGVYSDSEMTTTTDWLTVTVDNTSTGQLGYTATANDGSEARTAYVKLTATGENNAVSTVSFTVTQPQSGDNTQYWTLVTDVNDLSSDDEIIFVNETAKKAMGAQGNNNRAAVSIAQAGTATNLDVNNHQIADGELKAISGVAFITLGKTKISNTDYWTFGVDDGYLYAASSSDNYLRTQTTNNENGAWSISISNGNATITAQGSNTRKYLNYNSSSSLFSCYSSSNNNVQIYHKSGPKKAKTPSFSPAAGTYYLPQNVTISSETSGATIYYTIDGTDPTSASTAYSAPIPVSTTTTIKAIAVKSGFVDSDLSSATFTIEAGTQLNTPSNLTCADATKTYNSLTFTWSAVEHADNGYQYRLNEEGDWIDINVLTYTWEGLSANSAYTFEVKAKAWDNGEYTVSNAAKLVATTDAIPVLTSITIDEVPTKTSYTTNDKAISLAGATITAHYNLNKYDHNVTSSCTVTNASTVLAEAGENKDVTVSYTDENDNTNIKTATFQVTVTSGPALTEKEYYKINTANTKIATANGYDKYGPSNCANALTSYHSSYPSTASWYVTCGSAQTDGLWLGSNNNQKSKMTLGNGNVTGASAIASALSVNTMICSTSFENISKVVVARSSIGGTAPSKVYLLRSTDNGTTYTKVGEEDDDDSITFEIEGTPSASAIYAIVIKSTGYCQFKVPVVTFYTLDSKTTGGGSGAPANTNISPVADKSWGTLQ